MSLLPQSPQSTKVKLGSIQSRKVLSRYVKKSALLTMLLAVLGLWALQIIFAYLAELEALTDTYTYTQALTYIFYRTPYFLEQFIPTGALLGAVVGLGLLANNAELIVMRAAGVSIYRIVGWVLQPAIIFVLIALAINQYILPYSNLKANQIQEPNTALLASVNGYWTLQQSLTGSKTGNDIVFIDYADANGNIGEVKLWHLDDNNNLTSASKAKEGTYLSEASPTAPNPPKQTEQTTQYQWQLNNVRTLKLDERAAIYNAETSHSNSPSQTNPPDAKVAEINATRSAHILASNTPLTTKHTDAKDIISLPIAPSSVYLLTRRAEDLSLTQLFEHMQFTDRQGTRSLEHELAFWQKLLSPFAILSLVIVACSFVFGSLRTHSLGLRIVVAIIFGLLFDYFQELTGFVSLAIGVSPLLMVLLPIIGSAILGFYLLKRQS